MHNLDPKDMDELFRDGAAQHEYSYNPDAWAMMEEKLDRQDKRRYLWISLGGLMLLLVAAIVWYSQTDISAQQSTEIAVAPSSKQAEKSGGEVSSTRSPVQLTVDLSQDEINANDAHNASKVEAKTSTKEEYINASSKVSGRNIGAQNSKSNVDTDVISSEEDAAVSSLTVVHTQETPREDKPIPTAVDADKGEGTKPSSNIGAIVDKNNSIIVDKVPLLQSHVAYDQGEVVYDGVPTRSDLDLIASASTGRFAVTAFANPEWSTVGLSSTARRGYKIGLKLGYQFADRYQVDIGIARSEKKYGSDGQAFTNKDGWVDDIMPMWMDAKCNVIEIPLEMTYFLSGYKNNGLFLNIGLSSYFLNSEWYAFEYDEALMRPGLLMEINPEDVETNYHVAGVGKFAFGYQHVLSSHFALEVSPYLQIPLTGIGEGKVDLYTIGLQVGLKFNGK